MCKPRQASGQATQPALFAEPDRQRVIWVARVCPCCGSEFAEGTGIPYKYCPACDDRCIHIGGWCLVCGQCATHCLPSQRETAHTAQEWEEARAIYYGPGGVPPKHARAYYKCILEIIHPDNSKEYHDLPDS